MKVNREAEEKLEHRVLTALLDYNKDTGLFTWKQEVRYGIGPGTRAGSVDAGRTIIRINGIDYYAHRLAWFYVTKEWPSGIIDHIDRNRNNDKFENLRDTTHSVNNRNRDVYKKNISGVKGITYIPQSGRWRVQIRVDKKLIHVGCYVEKETAIMCLEKAKKAYNVQ